MSRPVLYGAAACVVEAALVAAAFAAGYTVAGIAIAVVFVLCALVTLGLFRDPEVIRSARAIVAARDGAPVPTVDLARPALAVGSPAADLAADADLSQGFTVTGNRAARRAQAKAARRP